MTMRFNVPYVMGDYVEVVEEWRIPAPGVEARHAISIGAAWRGHTVTLSADECSVLADRHEEAARTGLAYHWREMARRKR